MLVTNRVIYKKLYFHGHPTSCVFILSRIAKMIAWEFLTHHHSLSTSHTSDIQQVTTYDVPSTVAVKSVITCSLSTMYARIARWNSRKAEDTDAWVATYALFWLLTYGLLLNWALMPQIRCHQLVLLPPRIAEGCIWTGGNFIRAGTH